MKCLVYVLFVCGFYMAGGDAFRNLDFEGLVSLGRLLNNGSPGGSLLGSGFVEDLLPGWTLTSNGVRQNLMNYNAAPLGPTYFGITTREDESLVNFYFTVRNGSFPDGMSGDYGIFINTPDNVFAITQRGDIPTEANRLNLAAWVPRGMALETRLDGTLIMDGDISAFAGKNAELELKFYRSGTPFSGDGANIGLDRIQFIPEPSTWAMVGCGAALFLGLAWWRRSQP